MNTTGSELPPLLTVKRLDSHKSHAATTYSPDEDFEHIIFVTMVIVGTLLAVAGAVLTVLWIYRKQHNTRDPQMNVPLQAGSTDSACSEIQPPELTDKSLTI